MKKLLFFLDLNKMIAYVTRKYATCNSVNISSLYHVDNLRLKINKNHKMIMKLLVFIRKSTEVNYKVGYTF